MGPNSLLLREGLRIVSFLLIVCCYASGGVYGERVSQLSYPFWFFLTCLMCRGHSASFWISFRGIYSTGSYRFGVSIEEVSGTTRATILDGNPIMMFMPFTCDISFSLYFSYVFCFFLQPGVSPRNTVPLLSFWLALYNSLASSVNVIPKPCSSYFFNQ